MKAFVVGVLSVMILVSGVTAQVPEWQITCHRDTMTIRATASGFDTAPEASTIGRVAVGHDTGDSDATTGTTCAVTLNADGGDANCRGDENTPVDTPTGGCVSQLVVDLTQDALTVEPNTDRQHCPANTITLSNPPDTVDSRFSKLVYWQTKLGVLSDPQNGLNPDTGDPDQTQNELMLYQITCIFADSSETEQETDPSVQILALPLTDQTETVPPPVVTLEFYNPDDDTTTFSTGPTLGQEIGLRVTYVDDTQYWEQLLVTECVASNVGTFPETLTPNQRNLITGSCPNFAIHPDPLFTTYEYVDGLTTTKKMNLVFKAFRIGLLSNLYVKCSITTCSATDPGGICAHPTGIDLAQSQCTQPPLRTRYQRLMLYGSRSDAPEFFTSQLSTVIVLQPDNIIVSPDGQAAAGYTCLTTSTFSVLLSVLSLLVLVSLAVTITTCLQRRGGKARDMDLPITYTNYAVTGSKS